MHIWTSSSSDSFTFDEYFDYEQSRSPGMRYQEDLYRDAFNSADENQDQQIDLILLAIPSLKNQERNILNHYRKREHFKTVRNSL